MSQPLKSKVKSVDAETVKAWLDKDEIVLVDVRETSEYDKEHIPGSMLLPMSQFDAEIFPNVPGKMVVLHCAIGKRSESAGKMLLDEGYSGAVHLDGGIDAWKAAGFPTEIQVVPVASPSDLKSREPVYLCPPPGHVLKEEYLEPLGISSSELAEKIQATNDEVESVIRGELTVSVEMSLRLARYFSTAADFWVHLQMEHDLERARHQIGGKIRQQIQPRTASVP